MPTTTVSFGEHEVTVDYDYDRGEPERWNGLTGVGNPAIPPSLYITNVWVAGNCYDPALFSPAWIEQTETRLMEDLAEPDYGPEPERDDE